MWDATCLWFKTSIELFFIVLVYTGYCRSTDPRVVSIVSDGCNKSSSTLLYVVFESFYRCVNNVFNADKSSSPSFLDIYSLSTWLPGINALCMVIGFLVLWSISLNSYLVHSKNGFEYLTNPTFLSFWHGSCNRVLSREMFWFFWYILF